MKASTSLSTSPRCFFASSVVGLPLFSARKTYPDTPHTTSRTPRTPQYTRHNMQHATHNAQHRICSILHLTHNTQHTPLQVSRLGSQLISREGRSPDREWRDDDMTPANFQQRAGTQRVSVPSRSSLSSAQRSTRSIRLLIKFPGPHLKPRCVGHELPSLAALVCDPCTPESSPSRNRVRFSLTSMPCHETGCDSVCHRCSFTSLGAVDFDIDPASPHREGGLRVGGRREGCAWCEKWSTNTC